MICGSYYFNIFFQTPSAARAKIELTLLSYNNNKNNSNKNNNNKNKNSHLDWEWYLVPSTRAMAKQGVKFIN